MKAHTQMKKIRKDNNDRKYLPYYHQATQEAEEFSLD